MIGSHRYPLTKHTGAVNSRPGKGERMLEQIKDIAGDAYYRLTVTGSTLYGTAVDDAIEQYGLIEEMRYMDGNAVIVYGYR